MLFTTAASGCGTAIPALRSPPSSDNLATAAAATCFPSTLLRVQHVPSWVVESLLEAVVLSAAAVTASPSEEGGATAVPILPLPAPSGFGLELA